VQQSGSDEGDRAVGGQWINPEIAGPLTVGSAAADFDERQVPAFVFG
jgi:hypothetical protein